MPAWLSVSSPSMKSCDAVVKAMAEHRIAGDVTPNTSVSSDGSTERGCRVLVSGEGDVVRLFRAVQRAHRDVVCGSVLIRPKITEGCVLDIMDAVSACLRFY